MVGLLRRLRLLPGAAISREEAVAIAREECAQRGWPWREPIRVEEGWRSYVVRTNTEMRGGNCMILVSTRTGEVIEARRAPR